MLPAALDEAFEHLSRLRFDEYMELALYAPASGFFATSGQAGRREGDFITSPEVGPLFGSVLARRLDQLWDDLGNPEPFTVVEAGAGRGALAIALRAAEPRCAGSLHCVLVELSPSLRAAQHEHLDIADDKPLESPRGEGPWFSSASELPTGPITGAVLANELLDNIPFRLMVRNGDVWSEVCVERSGDGLSEVFVPAEEAVVRRLDELVPDAPHDCRVPWQGGAAVWVQRARSLLGSGSVILFDYGRPTAELAVAGQEAWLRTYRSHERGHDPYDAPGTRDITADVAIDQLAPADWYGTQAEWLEANGIAELVESAARTWDEQASNGGLEAMRARSVPLEAEALTDPVGLGGFRVLEWHAEVGNDPSSSVG